MKIQAGIKGMLARRSIRSETQDTGEEQAEEQPQDWALKDAADDRADADDDVPACRTVHTLLIASVRRSNVYVRFVATFKPFDAVVVVLIVFKLAVVFVL